MSIMYERIESLCKSNGINITQMCREVGIPRGNLTELKMGRTMNLSSKNAQKIANYFGVSVGYLLGEEETKNAPVANDRRVVTDEDIKFALFGGSGDITDAMYEEVKSFAAYIKSRGVKEAQ